MDGARVVRRPSFLTRVAALVAMVAGLAAGEARADLIVPANSQYILSSGVTDLACTDLVVGGQLLVQGGSVVNVRHVAIQPGGAIDGGSGTIELGGDWTNAGVFAGGSGSVRFADLCGLSGASIAGDTTFANARFATSIGKNYVFSVGSTQTIGGVLEIAGSSPLPVQFRSSSPGQTAFINLLSGGAQQIQHVGVTDVWATGQWLAASLTNEGGGGNANRWFGLAIPTTVAVPTVTGSALFALAALLAAVGAAALRRRAAAGHR